MGDGFQIIVDREVSKEGAPHLAGKVSLSPTPWRTGAPLTHPQILALVPELTETRQRRTVEVLLGECMKSREPAGSLEELILF